MTLKQLPELVPCREQRATAAAPHNGAVICCFVKDNSRRVAVGTGQFLGHRVLRSIAMQ